MKCPGIGRLHSPGSNQENDPDCHDKRPGPLTYPMSQSENWKTSGGLQDN